MLDRELITHADYTSFQAPLPADIARDPDVAALMSPGDLVTVYNLDRAKLPVYTSQQRDKTIPDLTSTYNGFDFAMTARTAGRRNALRQLDGREKHLELLRERRQSRTAC